MFNLNFSIKVSAVHLNRGLHLKEISYMQTSEIQPGPVNLTSTLEIEVSVPLTGVSALHRCPPYTGVRLTGVSTLHRCPPYRGVHLTEVSPLQRCLPYRAGVHFERVNRIKSFPTNPVFTCY